MYALSRLAFERGNTDVARSLHSEGLSRFTNLGDREGIAESVAGLTAQMLSQAETEQAVRLWGTAHSLRKRIGISLTPVELAAHNRLMEQARSALGDDAFASAWEVGRAPSWEQAAVSALEGRVNVPAA